MERPKLNLRVREVLKDKGIKQQELADRIGKSFQMVNGIVNGRGVSVAILADIADALGVTMDELIADRPVNAKPISERPSFVALIRDGSNSYSAYSWAELHKLTEAHLLDSAETDG